MKKNTLSLLLSLFATLSSTAQLSSVKADLLQIVKNKKAKIGVAARDLSNGDTLTIANEFHYPMQSVYKLHLALAILNKADEGKLSLEQKIKVRKEDLRTGTWSPLQKKYPEGNIELPLRELLRYTISNSDNNSCDILFKLVGGPEHVNKYIQSIGIKNTAIVATEKQMDEDPALQYRNWSTPYAAVQLLHKVYKEKLLSDSSFACLNRQMTISENAHDRLKGKLPSGAVVAHKTGTSDRDKENRRTAINDIGVITTPDGKQFAIAVFIAESAEDDKTKAAIMADISKILWDYFSGQQE